MALSGRRTFVGIGFGPIQAGLFLLEAFKSGNFARLVAAELQQEIVDAVRREDGFFTVNIAHADHIEQAQIGPIELYNPSVPADAEQIIQAIALAEEVSTAVPSVAHYGTGDPASVQRLLAEGLRRKTRQTGPADNQPPWPGTGPGRYRH